MRHADEAVAAADQVETLARTTGDARLTDLSRQARAAAQRAQQAAGDAQLIVAASEGERGQHDLDAAARQARSAATEATRIAIEANQGPR